MWQHRVAGIELALQAIAGQQVIRVDVLCLGDLGPQQQDQQCRQPELFSAEIHSGETLRHQPHPVQPIYTWARQG